MDVKPLGHSGCVIDVYATQQHHCVIQNKGHNMKRSVHYVTCTLCQGKFCASNFLVKIIIVCSMSIKMKNQIAM